jgi:lipopolysaccharide export system protein LptC
MQDHYKQIGLISLLIIIVAYTSWLLHSMHSQDLLPSHDEIHPDFFVKDMTYTETDDNGQLHTVFSTPQMLHYSKNNSAFYITPHIVAYSNEGKQPWDITAKHAESIKGNKQLILWDTVKIHEPPGEKNADTWITTSKLIVFPNQNYAVSDQPVTFTEPGLAVNSVGMKVFFKEKRVELLNQARGSYDDQQANSKKLF